MGVRLEALNVSYQINNLMKKLVLLLVFFVTATTVAQRDEAYVNAKVSEFTPSLQERGVDTFFTTYRYCLGKIEIIDLGNGERCASRGTFYEVYIFWKEENGDQMMKRIDNCGMFYSVEVSTPDVVGYYMDNMEQLHENKVRGYETAEASEGPTQRTEIHNCYRRFEFTSNRGTSKQQYNLFDLTNEADNKNIHYEYNNGLKVVALDGTIDMIINENLARLRRQQ